MYRVELQRIGRTGLRHQHIVDEGFARPLIVEDAVDTEPSSTVHPVGQLRLGHRAGLLTLKYGAGEPHSFLISPAAERRPRIVGACDGVGRAGSSEDLRVHRDTADVHGIHEIAGRAIE